jgi:hypothetical protein
VCTSHNTTLSQSLFSPSPKTTQPSPLCTSQIQIQIHKFRYSLYLHLHVTTSPLPSIPAISLFSESSPQSHHLPHFSRLISTSTFSFEDSPVYITIKIENSISRLPSRPCSTLRRDEKINP